MTAELKKRLDDLLGYLNYKAQARHFNTVLDVMVELNRLQLDEIRRLGT